MKLPCSVSAEQGFSQTLTMTSSAICRRKRPRAQGIEAGGGGVGRKSDAVKPIRTSSGLSREDLRDAIYKAIPTMTRDQSKRILDEIFEEIIAALAKDEDVRFRGFGKFKVQHKRPRIGRNPVTQESAMITQRRVVKFAPSRNLISLVNKDVSERLGRSNLM